MIDRRTFLGAAAATPARAASPERRPNIVLIIAGDASWSDHDMERGRTGMHGLAAARPVRVRAMAAPWMWTPQYGENRHAGQPT